MKYGTMILRQDGSFDFYSRLAELHENESIEVSYQHFMRELRKEGFYECKNGSKVFRKAIVRAGT